MQYVRTLVFLSQHFHWGYRHLHFTSWDPINFWYGGGLTSLCFICCFLFIQNFPNKVPVLSNGKKSLSGPSFVTRAYLTTQYNSCSAKTSCFNTTTSFSSLLIDFLSSNIIFAAVLMNLLLTCSLGCSLFKRTEHSAPLPRFSFCNNLTNVRVEKLGLIKIMIRYKTNDVW